MLKMKLMLERNCSVPSQLRAILACMSRDFGIFMPKHLAVQWLLNSYVRTMIYLNYFKRSGETLFIYFSREVWSINAGTTPCLEIQKPAANVAILIALHKS